jgi:hypothetical protein
MASARGGMADSVGCRSTEQSTGGSEMAQSGQARRGCCRCSLSLPPHPFPPPSLPHCPRRHDGAEPTSRALRAEGGSV